MALEQIIEKQTVRKTDKWIDELLVRQTDRQTTRQKERQTKRQNEKELQKVEEPSTLCVSTCKPDGDSFC